MNRYNVNTNGYRVQRRKRQFKPNRLIRLLSLACVLVVLFFVLRLVVDLKKFENTFYPGVTIEGVTITGNDKQTVEQYFQNVVAAQLAEQKIRIQFDQNSWELTPEKLSARKEVSAVVDRAWALGHEGNWLQRQSVIRSLRQTPVDFKLELQYDQGQLDNFVASIIAQIARDAQEGQVDFVEKDGIYVPVVGESKVGYRLDANQLTGQLIEALQSGESQVIALNPEIIEPSSGVTQPVLLAEHSTSLKKSGTDRNMNVELGLTGFDQKIVLNGETVSVNSVIGKRTKKRGFRPAQEFVGTSVQEGIGGGVCQSSTTLYCALLKVEGIEFLERHAHSMRVGYTKPGLDASITDNGKDLVFTNNTGHTLYLSAGIMETDKGRRAYVKVWGTPKDPNVKITLESETIKTIPAKKEYVDDRNGQYVTYTDEEKIKSEGKDGIKSKSYRVYTNAETGEEIKREIISQDTYSARNAVYWRGIQDRFEEYTSPDEDI